MLDTRFDDMTDEELADVLRLYDTDATPVESADADDALFPPSPPPVTKKEHPLRVLSRAVKELREVIGRLEDENDKLRAGREPVVERSDQVSVDCAS